MPTGSGDGEKDLKSSLLDLNHKVCVEGRVAGLGADKGAVLKAVRRAFSPDELWSPVFYRDLVAETLVSCVYIMFVVFSLGTLNPQAYSPNTTHSGLLVGIIVFLLIEAFGHISGCHINPAVSWVMLLNGKITVIRALLYSIVQCCGCLAGAMIAFGCSPEALQKAYKPFRPSNDISATTGMIVELVLTFNLIFVALSTFDARRRVVTMPALPTGLSIGCGIFAAGTYTGGCMNPIVALGPAFVSRNFTDHWIYWAGDYIGATLAVIVYRVFMLIEDKSPSPAAFAVDQTSMKQNEIQTEILRLVQALKTKEEPSCTNQSHM